MVNSKASTLRPTILDFCGFALLLAGLNALVAREDPLWLAANPNPWLLLPVYIGCRYGFSAGTVGGLLVAGVASLCAVTATGGDFVSALLAHRFLLLGFIVGGLLTGAVRTIAIRRSRELEETASRLADENQRLCSDYELLEETRYLLQERLALFGAETSALDTQLRSLFAPGAGPVLPGLLDLLKDVSSVDGACILSTAGVANDQAKVLAGLDSKWKDNLTIPLPDLAAEALSNKQCVTWKTGGSKKNSEPFLAAIPFGEGAVVLIERMPFARVTKHAFVQIDTIVQWVGRFAFQNGSTETADSKTEVNADEFGRHEKLARETFEKLRLPSTVAEFEFAQPKKNGTASVDTFHRVVSEHVRAPRVACKTGDRTFRVLLPMEGIRDAEQFAANIQKQLAPVTVDHQIKLIGSSGTNGAR